MTKKESEKKHSEVEEEFSHPKGLQDLFVSGVFNLIRAIARAAKITRRDPNELVNLSDEELKEILNSEEKKEDK